MAKTQEAPDAVGELIGDAQLVARALVRLGKLSDATFLTALNEVKDKRTAAGGAVDPAAVIKLQTSLSAAIAGLAPITLRDLRKGWSPVRESAGTRAAVVIFATFCIFLLIFVAYATQLHEDASQAYRAYDDMQKNRFQEQAFRLANDVFKELNSPDAKAQPGVLWTDVLGKSVVDIVELDNRLQSVVARHSELEKKADIYGRLVAGFTWLSKLWSPDKDGVSEANPSGNATISGYLEAYKAAPEAQKVPPSGPFFGSCVNGNPIDHNKPATTATATGAGRAESAAGTPADVNKPAAIQAATGPSAAESVGGTPADVNEPAPSEAEAGASRRERMGVSLEEAVLTLNCLGEILGANGIQISRLSPSWIDQFKLKHNIDILGLWLLPALYGALGTALFFLRGFIEPSVPNPSWPQVFYRMALGGFVGTIVAWFWTPGSSDVTTPAIANLSSFTLAFIVGYSLDMFFRYLDSITLRFQQASTKPAGTPAATAPAPAAPTP